MELQCVLDVEEFLFSMSRIVPRRVRFTGPYSMEVMKRRGGWQYRLWNYSSGRCLLSFIILDSGGRIDIGISGRINIGREGRQGG